MGLMNSSISKIIKQLEKYKRKVVSRINDGLNREDILRFIDDLDISFREDFYELYSTINGTDINPGDILDDYHFFPGFYLLNLNDAISYYRALIKNELWDKNWFPIFANGGGDFFCVVCSNSTDGKSPILGFIVGEEPEIEFINIENMMRTISKCYIKGAYYLTEDNYLEIDDELECKIASKYNPGLERWT